MKIVLCIAIGYLLGTLSPAALLSKLKNINLRKQGTGNLGATNTMLVLGKGYGALVMILDIAKAFIAVKIAEAICPGVSVVGLLTGFFAVIGHIYPFYMKFKGGKGLAAFGGMILAADPRLFLLLLLTGIVLMLIINYSIALPISAAILFPILYGLYWRSLTAVLICAATSILIIAKHFSIFAKIKRGDEIKVRGFIKTRLFR